jgi:hypothetical protein
MAVKIPTHLLMVKRFVTLTSRLKVQQVVAWLGRRCLPSSCRRSICTGFGDGDDRNGTFKMCAPMEKEKQEFMCIDSL